MEIKTTTLRSTVCAGSNFFKIKLFLFYLILLILFRLLFNDVGYILFRILRNAKKFHVDFYY